MRLTRIILCASAVQTVYALIDIPRNGTVAENAFVSPVLSRDVVTDQSNFQSDSIPVPVEFQSKISELEYSLGAEGTQVDARSGRVESLTLSQPLLPGRGVENQLLWTVASDVNSLHGSPSTSAEWEALAIQALKTWMEDHAAKLEINVSTELFVEGSVRAAVHGDGDMIQLSIPRIYRGIPVIGARAMATIKLGNLINVGFEDWGAILDDFNVTPTLNADDARETLAQQMELTLTVGNEKCEAELQILTLTPDGTKFGQGYEYVLAWRVCPIFENQDVEVMEGLIDAHSGTVYSFVDKVHYLQAKGGVYPISNDGRTRNSIPDGIEQLGWPMPFMYIGNDVTDTGGNYFAAGDVTASFHGPYAIVDDRCGVSSLTSSGGLDWGGSSGTDCVTPDFGGAGNTHSARTTFYEVNKVVEMAMSHLPSNEWLKNKLLVNINRPSTCNAFWGGRGINFYRSGGGCGNTGELAGVIVHEWGHGMDDNDVEGSISSPSGEGIADIYAALRMGDSCIGRGFFATSSKECTGVRNIDYLQGSGSPKTFSNNGCGGAVHCLGGVYSEAVWSLYKRFLQSAPYNYDDNTALEIVTRLTFIAAGNVKTWFSGSPPFGGCGSASGYREYLAADDDNGNLNDGTPHMKAIFDAFNEHEIACYTPTVQDSGCSGTPSDVPHVTVTPGDMQAVITWSAVSGAINYQLFRSEGIKGCEQGKVKLTTTTSLSFIDTGLMNDREYHYIVIPKGLNDACFGPASICTTAVPSEAPVPTTPTPTIKPSTTAPTVSCGNGICEPDEFDFSCFADCGNKELNLLTDARKGANGIMFKIKASERDVDIKRFKIVSWTTSTNLIQVYTKAGEYRGFEHNNTAWELVHDSNVELKGPNSFSDINVSTKVHIPPGVTRSFFIYITDGSMKYHDGSEEGSLLGSDDFIEFYEGVGLTSKFDGTDQNVYSPRRFSGIVSYSILDAPKPTTKQPTTQPSTQKPTRNPSKRPTNVPTTLSPTAEPTNHPTASPTHRCGNGTCEAEETSTTCPQDCYDILFSPNLNGTKGALAAMLDVGASRDVAIKSFSFFTSDKRQDLIRVYTRSGSYSGHELDEVDWQLVFAQNVTYQGRQTPTTLKDFDTSVTIRAGTTQAFLIATTSFILYDEGVEEGAAFASDASLTIYDGAGVNQFAGIGSGDDSIFAPRRFRGSIRYDAIKATDSPTLAPTTPPSTQPSKSPSRVPTKSPTRRPSKMPVTSTPTSGMPITEVPTSNELSCYPKASAVKISATTGNPINMFEVLVFSTSGVNVAMSGMATQSTTLKSLEASHAIDGNWNSFSHTSKSEDGSFDWWMVELSESFEIGSVEIANRWCQDPADANDCLGRLSYAKLSLLSANGSVIETRSVGNTSGKLSLTIDFKSPKCQSPKEITSTPTSSPVATSPAQLPEVKSVRVHAVTGNPLQFFELRVISNGVNVAFNGTASQSSTLGSLYASNAIDGNLNSFSHTTNENLFSWWQLDLATEVPVETIVILNRYCQSPEDPKGCLCRLSHSILSFFDSNGQWITSTSMGDTCGVLEWTQSFTESPATGVCTWSNFD